MSMIGVSACKVPSLLWRLSQHGVTILAGQLFRQLVDLFQFYMLFPISNYDSEPISDEDMMAAHYARVQQLQLLLFYKHPALKDLALHNCGTVASRKDLMEHVGSLDLQELKQLVIRELRQIPRISKLPQAFVSSTCVEQRTKREYIC